MKQLQDDEIKTLVELIKMEMIRQSDMVSQIIFHRGSIGIELNDSYQYYHDRIKYLKTLLGKIQEVD